MEDIIIMDPEQTEYEQIDVYDPVSEDKQDIETIDKIEKIEKVKEESISNESKQVNQSDDIVFIGDGINNLNSIKSINLNNIDNIFDKELLYSTDNSSSMTTGNITLNEDITNFDYVLINYIGSARYQNESSVIVGVNDFLNSGNITYPEISLSIRSANGTYYTRYVRSSGNNTVYTSSSYNDIGIIKSIYGLKEKTVVNPTPNPSNPSVSGNVVNNYYITVSGSDASLSYNLLNKPLNNYSVSESILLFIFMGLFVAGFSWFIKKNIFKL